jgi:hypothetical protein
VSPNGRVSGSARRCSSSSPAASDVLARSSSP